MSTFRMATTFVSLMLLALALAADPQPVQIPASTEWFGYDGNWSPVNLRIGSPQQWVSLFPSTLGQDTWVIGAAGCDDTVACIEKRGGIFKSNQSSAWNPLGGFDLNFQPALGNSGAGYYGLDTISVENAIVLKDQIVGIINSTDFLLGSFGLGVTPSNFTAEENQPTFLSSMVENISAIPSHSYGYTAGAHYRLKGVPASLTLGGVDLNRHTPNEISFELQNSFEPVVAINKISVTSEPLATSPNKPKWAGEPLELLGKSQAQLFSIDSSTPFFWLPEDVCDAFAVALNLTYNETLQLYQYSKAADPSTLEDWNLNFVFTIADLPGSTKSIEINIPYDAFNHQLTFPYPALNATFGASPVSYFPLRRAANNTQYTIGRAFLQEAYLTVDYERSNFSISQAEFANNALTNVDLVAITKPANSYFNRGKGSSGLSTGAKAGIGAGVGVVVIGLAVVAFLYLRSRKRKTSAIKADSPSEKKGFFQRLSFRDTKKPSADATELLADKHHPLEVAADQTNSRFELPEAAPIEMPAHIPPQFYTTEDNRYQNTTAELEHRNSTAKNSHLIQERGSRSPALPPYSPTQVGRGPTSPVSSNAYRGTGTNTGTSTSGISNLSPNETSPHNIHQVSPGTVTGPNSPNNAPISPPEPSPLMVPSSNDGFHSRSSLNLPKSDRDQTMPSRSVSRASRFTEEGIKRESQPAPAGRKFSFDEGR